MTIILFLAVLFVLILVHEWGHFIAAKKTGMRVDEFGIGFPPKLWGVKKGETEYTLNALPIGGFVRIYGENGEEPFSPVSDEVGDGRSEPLSGEAGQGGSQSNAQQAKIGKYSDYERSFTAKSKWAQAIVLVAGVTMNVVFAWVLFAAAFMIGVPTAVDEATAGENAQLTVAGVLPNSPAAAAGLTPGMAIVSAERIGVSPDSLTPSAFSAFTRASADSISLTVAMGEETKIVTVTPEVGLVTDEPNAYALGVSLSMVEEQSLSPLSAIKEATLTTVSSLKAITVGLFTLAAQSIKGTADLSQVAGPVGIVSLVGDAAQFGFTALLMFTAIISLNLAVINLLPIPALDGGRLVFVGIEALIRRPLSPVWVARVNFAGFAFLMLLILAVTYSDIFLK